MDEVAAAFVEHLKERFPQLEIDGGPIYPQYEPTGHDFHWELRLACGIDITAPVARLKLLGTQLHLHTGVDANRYQFQDKKCGQLDLASPASVDQLDEWLQRQIDYFNYWEERLSRDRASRL